MKTCSGLYPKVWEFENLYLAWRKARKGKRRREQAAAFERVQEEELLNLQEELRGFTYQPGEYHSFYIHDPKKRLISAAPTSARATFSRRMCVWNNCACGCVFRATSN